MVVLAAACGDGSQRGTCVRGSDQRCPCSARALQVNENYKVAAGGAIPSL